ncbi:hypothetical protein N7467_003011 [Penicillium canescens]|nr:hypothetical protein N7467_003011 [Penicillium canescens]
MPNDKLTKHDGPLVERILASRSQNERKLLTHGDLDPSNIMVKDCVITEIIDWGASGYSPSLGNTVLYDSQL